MYHEKFRRTKTILWSLEGKSAPCKILGGQKPYFVNLWVYPRLKFRGWICNLPFYLLGNIHFYLCINILIEVNKSCDEQTKEGKTSVRHIEAVLEN